MPGRLEEDDYERVQCDTGTSSIFFFSAQGDVLFREVWNGDGVKYGVHTPLEPAE